MSELNTDQRQQILSVLKDGRKIEAIKLYRDFSGASLLEAKTFIEQLITTLETGQLPPSLNDDSTEFDGRLLELLAEGKKIQAIKEYREANSCSLKQAKDAVDKLQLQLGDIPQSGCATSALCFIAITTWALTRWLA